MHAGEPLRTSAPRRALLDVVIDSAWGLLLILALLLYQVTGEWGAVNSGLSWAALVAFGLFFVLRISTIKDVLTSRSTYYGANMAVVLLAFVGLLTTINYLGAKHSLRKDVTKGGVHTLSPQTMNILSSLEQPVKALAFFSDADVTGRPTAEDQLREFDYASDQFSYEFIDPEQHPEKAARYDVKTMGTVVLLMGDRKERVTTVGEQELATALLKLTRDHRPKVLFVTGHGEHGIDDFSDKGYSKFKEALEKDNYEVEELVLANAASGIPEETAVVVVGGPKKSLFETEKEALQTYLEAGGHVLFLVDAPPAPGLADLIAPWGIEVAEDLILDVSPIGKLFGAGPTVPLVAKYEWHTITKDLDGLMTFFPLARSVGKAATIPDGVTVTEIVRSGKQAWGETDLGVLETSEAEFDPEKDRVGPLAIATVAFRDLPAAAKDSAAQDDEDKGGTGPKKQARVAVFGDSDFATNFNFDQQGNGDLALNTVSWLAGDDTLVSIRPKTFEDPPLRLTAHQMNNIFWFTVVLAPLALLIVGSMVWMRRR